MRKTDKLKPGKQAGAGTDSDRAVNSEQPSVQNRKKTAEDHLPPDAVQNDSSIKEKPAEVKKPANDAAVKEAVLSSGSTRFQPGVSGNPSGRPKRTPAETKALNQIRKLAPEAAKIMKEMLQDSKTPAAVRVKICEIILDRTFGKAPASISLSTDSDKVAESRSYILSLVSRIRGEDPSSGNKPGLSVAASASDKPPDGRAVIAVAPVSTPSGETGAHSAPEEVDSHPSV